MWTITGAGEWVWMLRPATEPRSIFHPDETYHLRVWYVPGPGVIGGWHGAIVLDGEYDRHIQVQKTADWAKAVLLKKAREVLTGKYRGALWPS